MSRLDTPLGHVVPPNKQGRDPSETDSDNNRNQTLGDSDNISINDRLLLILG
jgi:hypothetical protein